MTAPTVSVIIPAYNAERFIAEAVSSVLGQSYSDLECLVIDDGSTDATREVLRGFGKAVRVISQENRGVSHARNRGIHASNGEWIAFLDADDLWRPDKLRVQLDDLEDTPNIKLHSTNLSLERSHLRAVDYFDHIGLACNMESCLFERPAATLLKCHFPWLQSTLVNRSLIDRAGLFNTAISLYEDFEWLLKLSFTSAWMVNRRVLVDIKRRDNGDTSLSAVRNKNRLRAAETMLAILDRQFDRMSGIEAAILADALSGQFSYVGNLLRESGNISAARRRYLQGAFKGRAPKLAIKYLLTFLPQRLSLR